MVDTVKALADLAARDGAATTGFAVLLALIIYQTIASSRRAKAREEAEERRTEMMLKRIIEGDGNGGASIHKVLTATNNAVELAKSADEKATQALDEVHAVRKDVLQLRTDGCVNLPAHLRAAHGGVK